jgi:hypothetical protein
MTSTMPCPMTVPICASPPRCSKPLTSPNAVFCALQNASVIELKLAMPGTLVEGCWITTPFCL